MATSSIEWTDRVWNPTVGCTKVSAGCKHCYAETMHARLKRMGQPKYAEPFTTVKPWPAQLADPLSWKKPARIFVNSMSDLFHDDVPDEYIAAVFGVMAAATQHTFQVLTKRAERMARWFKWLRQAATDHGYARLAFGIREAVSYGVWRMPYVTEEIRQRIARDEWPLPNVWLGVSVEDQEQADARIPRLLRTPAAVRFLSCEPLLGPLRLDHLDVERAADREWCFIDALTGRQTDMGRPCREVPHVDWVIVGGESGHGARSYDLAWPRSIIAQCRAAGVPVFHKQVGTRPLHPEIPAAFLLLENRKGGNPAEWPEDLRVREFPVGGR